MKIQHKESKKIYEVYKIETIDDLIGMSKYNIRFLIYDNDWIYIDGDYIDDYIPVPAETEVKNA